jgi:hypothetical protein
VLIPFSCELKQLDNLSVICIYFVFLIRIQTAYTMIMETFGSLVKEEHLKNVESGIIPNTLVLENLEPFPGYYGATPSDRMPDAFFLVITQKESTEKILRLTHIIKNNSNIDFEGSPGRICIYNDIYHSIRLRGISDYSLLADIQNYYRDAGINFMKKKTINAPGIIQIKKIFPIEPFTDDIFKDKEHEMFYLKIDKQVSWSHFKSVTQKVKNNLQSAGFDAALAVIYTRKVMDLIRIYGKDINLESLTEIHKKYNDFLLKSIYEVKQ